MAIWMPLIIILLFIGGLITVALLEQMGGTMKEKAALVFEVYRYTVCFVMVLVFTLMAYTVLSGVFSGQEANAVAGAGLGVLLSVALYFIHWKMKNPNLS